MNTSSSLVMPKALPKQAVSLKQTPIIEEALSAQNSKAVNTSNIKLLQPDQVFISKESQDKLLKENSLEKASDKIGENTETTEEEIKETGATEINKDEQVDASSDKTMSELDEVIAELEMKILELTVEIELLKVKGDEESLKEAEKLEIDLAMLKGMLEAKLKIKLDMAKINVT